MLAGMSPCCALKTRNTAIKHLTEGNDRSKINEYLTYISHNYTGG